MLYTQISYVSVDLFALGCTGVLVVSKNCSFTCPKLLEQHLQSLQVLSWFRKGLLRSKMGEYDQPMQ